VPDSPGFHHPFEAYLERTARLATRGEGALMIIDVDYFKAVNDRYGHMSGDEALRMISGEIKGCMRENDLVGRIGGEEFDVFLLSRRWRSRAARDRRPIAALTEARMRSATTAASRRLAPSRRVEKIYSVKLCGSSPSAPVGC